MDVPRLEVLQRRGIHGDQRRMDDRPRIHQRARQRIAARLDHAGKRAADHLQRVRLQRQREHARRQPLGADGDRRLEGPVLAREPGQRAGFRERDLGAVAGIPGRLGKQHRTERAGRQEHHLPVGQMRRERARNIRLCRRRSRTQNELGAAHGLGDVGGDQRRLAPRAGRGNP